MPPGSLPFLCQTRSLQHAFRLVPFTRTVRLARFFSDNGRGSFSDDGPGEPSDEGHSIPFDWQDEPREYWPENPLTAQSTITPSEAEIFKGIFDEIAQGRMPQAQKQRFARSLSEQSNAAPAMPGVFPEVSPKPINHARVTEFRDKFLSRYPPSLRQAAQMAFGLFEAPPVKDGGDTSFLRLAEANEASWAERAKYTQMLLEEQTRVETLMNKCTTDIDLWNLMEVEIFSLPKRLGIKPVPVKSAAQIMAEEEAAELAEAQAIKEEERQERLQKRKAARFALMSPEEQQEVLEKEELMVLVRSKIKEKKQHQAHKRQAAIDKREGLKSKRRSKIEVDRAAVGGALAGRIMPPIPKTEPITDRRLLEIHGRLYPHFLHTGMNLFDTKFALSSPLAFKIFPRLRQLGLPSYVLGISTPLYSKLASMYWTRYGDFTSALNVLQEMLQTGMYASKESRAVVKSIRNHVHRCAWGSHGPFVQAIMGSSPYDAKFEQRLETVRQQIRTSMAQMEENM